MNKPMKVVIAAVAGAVCGWAIWETTKLQREAAALDEQVDRDMAEFRKKLQETLDAASGAGEEQK